jgi:hypothetical protein
MCHKWPGIWSICCNHNTVLLSYLLTFHLICTIWRVPLVEQEHPSSHPGFSGVGAAWYLFFYVDFVDHCLSLRLLCCIFCPSSIYGFWLRLGLWYLTPLSTIFQLYNGGQFTWWRKSHNVVSSTHRYERNSNSQR